MLSFEKAQEFYRKVRSQSVALASPLSAEDCCVQPAEEASPTKWNLAHTTWFFETFLLERWEKPFHPFDVNFRVLFNSYYNAVGEKHPRPQRGMLTRPSLDQVLHYRRNVDQRLLNLPERVWKDPEFHNLLELGLNHEQQHQELLLTDQKLLFSYNPLAPAYHEVDLSRTPSRTQGAALSWKSFPEGMVHLGHTGEGFAFDNETPQHRVFVNAYQLASRLTTNAEYAQFVDQGGYQDPQYWLAEGWDWCQKSKRTQPLYWRKQDGKWYEFTLWGLGELDPVRPVVHVGYFEADAFARWAHARLPTEAEWENAAQSVPLTGHFADSGEYHPRPAPEGELVQMLGDAWEWTSSSYSPYPGYQAAPGAVGEYNGKFMVNQYVLRGGSCATPEGHIRKTYRNFFPTWACWQFSGIRLAREL
ncbi:MAG: ergothioneine biosynthesis protein EgtB [Spirochaetales bacterium]|nr:ergothioneine biosynthesis protein EgtB [Spirochaetales bacterium]